MIFLYHLDKMASTFVGGLGDHINIFEQIYNNKLTQTIIAILLCVLLAFEHQIEVFGYPGTFFILLMLSIALVLTELHNTPGIVYLMMGLTIVSFNMNVNNKRKNAQ